MLRLGKLDNDDLERLVLHKFRRVRSESLSAPAIGQDCATLDFSNDLIVLSCDPITSASSAHLGRLTVHVCCNDAAAAGAEPVGLLVTLLLPPTSSLEEIGRIADDLSAAAQLANVDILGGHTEVTDSVTRPVTSATVVARQARGKALIGMKPGDEILMTKSAAIEGTTILAEDFPQLLTAVPDETLAKARAFSGKLSIVPESAVAMQFGAVAMHDVTEGGVLGAVWELAYANGCGAEVFLDRIPVREETAALCKALRLDPLRLIGSGSLLIACKDGDALVHALQSRGIDAAVIGRAIAGKTCLLDGTPMEEPHADEIYRLYDRA
ncbi:MAG TPA: AIR synthase family protein [Feifaniaceae bacterium]|nr:AIR synthase family protein [Feifaniaceae bacterium]